MKVFLRGIPAHTKRHDIVKFVEPEVKGGFFRKKGHIKSIKILVFRDLSLNILEYHGLVTVEPDLAAERVVRRLNRKKFLGKYIAVRKYIERSWHNDRRLNAKTAAILRRDRRENDRRRGAKLEIVEDVTSMFSGREGFQRKGM